MKILLIATLLTALPVMAADIYTFTVSDSVTVTSVAGLESGWGYTLQNGSSTDWLVTTGLNASTFQHATPQLIFDFPDLAPGQSVTVPYDPVTPAGLYQILWDQNAPLGFVNAGAFTLSAQWWKGDPANGGTLIGSATDASQPYTASLTAVPEPGTSALIALPLLVFGVIAVRRSRTVMR